MDPKNDIRHLLNTSVSAENQVLKPVALKQDLNMITHIWAKLLAQHATLLTQGESSENLHIMRPHPNRQFQSYNALQW